MKKFSHPPYFRRPRSRVFRVPRGVKLTAEEDLSPEPSPTKNPRSIASQTSPTPDLAESVSPPPLPSPVGHGLRPWVKLRRRRLPQWAYRRLPNWFYPERSTHEPYFPPSYNIASTYGGGLEATAGFDASAAEDESRRMGRTRSGSPYIDGAGSRRGWSGEEGRSSGREMQSIEEPVIW